MIEIHSLGPRMVHKLEMDMTNIWLGNKASRPWNNLLELPAYRWSQSHKVSQTESFKGSFLRSGGGKHQPKLSILSHSRSRDWFSPPSQKKLLPLGTLQENACHKENPLKALKWTASSSCLPSKDNTTPEHIEKKTEITQGSLTLILTTIPQGQELPLTQEHLKLLQWTERKSTSFL